MDMDGENQPTMLAVEGGMDARSAAVIEEVMAGLPGRSATAHPDEQDLEPLVQDVIPVVGKGDNVFTKCQVEAGDRQAHIITGGNLGAWNITEAYSTLLQSDTRTARLERKLIATRRTVALEEIEAHALQQETARQKQADLKLHNVHVETEHLQNRRPQDKNKHWI